MVHVHDSVYTYIQTYVLKSTASSNAHIPKCTYAHTTTQTGQLAKKERKEDVKFGKGNNILTIGKRIQCLERSTDLTLIK